MKFEVRDFLLVENIYLLREIPGEREWTMNGIGIDGIFVEKCPAKKLVVPYKSGDQKASGQTPKMENPVNPSGSRDIVYLWTPVFIPNFQQKLFH